MRRKFNHLLEMSGGGFQGGLRVVIPPAEQEERLQTLTLLSTDTRISQGRKRHTSNPYAMILQTLILMRETPSATIAVAITKIL